MADPTKRAGFIAFLLLILMLAACQQAEPTPTEPAQVPKLPDVPLQAIETTMLTLLRNPVAYQGQLVRLTGAYKPVPIAICEDEVHRSPASWSLKDGEAETMAAGFDRMLRELAQPGITLVVEGQWQQWEGPVGCGRRAPESQIWYLDVTNIISPNPLVSSPSEGDLVAEATPQAVASPTPVETGDQEATDAGQESIATPGTAVTLAPGTTVATATSTATGPTATPRPSITATSPTPRTATVTTTPTTTGTPSTSTPTATATATSQSGTPTATATGGAAATVSPTPSATASTAELLDFDNITVENIGAGTAKSWRFEGISGERITVSAGPVPGLDISLELLDPNGQSLETQNQAGNGIAEVISDVDTVDGDYELIVRSISGSGDYSIFLLTTDSLPFMVHQGNISYGQNKSRSVPEDIDDMWHFEGSAGEVVTIRADANSEEDIVLYLTGPDGVELDFADNDIDQGPPDDFEEISQFSLPQTGLYVIGVGESDFLAFSYTLTLNN